MNFVALAIQDTTTCEEMPGTGKKHSPALPWTPAEAQESLPPNQIWTLLPSLVLFLS